MINALHLILLPINSSFLFYFGEHQLWSWEGCHQFLELQLHHLFLQDKKKKKIDYYPWHKRKLLRSVKTSGEHWLSHTELRDRIFSLPTSADISWNTDYFPPTLERDSYFKGQGIEGRKQPVLAKTTVNPLCTNALDKVLANVVPNSSSSPFRFWYSTLSRNLFESPGKVICNNTSRISQHLSSLATCVSNSPVRGFNQETAWDLITYLCHLLPWTRGKF